MKELLFAAALLLQQPEPSSFNILSGQITYFDGETAANVRVMAVSIGGPGDPVVRTTRANADGIFRFEALAAGLYYIQTVPIGPQTFYPGVASELDATPVKITPGSVLENLNFRLTAETSGVRLRGRVIIPAGYALDPNVRVQSFGSSPVQVREAPVAEDGSFELRHVRPGSHKLAVLGVPGMEGTEITVEDRDVENLELVLPPLVSVRGIVTMESRSSAPLLGLTFTRQDAPIRAGTQSSADGAFQVSLPSGAYAVGISDLPQNLYLRAMTSDSVDLRDNLLKLDDSADEIPVAITLGTSAGVEIAGRLLLSEGAEADAARRIVIEDRITGRRHEAQIQDDRSFHFERVMPGKYAAAVVKPDAVSSPGFSITVPETGIRDLEVSVPGLAEISGRVTVDGGGPPPKFLFALVRGTAAGLLPDPSVPGQLPVLSASSLGSLLRPDGGTQVLQIALDARPDGTFQIKVPPGEYRVAAIGTGIPEPFVLRSMSYGSMRLFEEPMVVPVAGPNEELEVGFGPAVSNAWLTISGRVTGIDAAASPLRIALESGLTSAIETPINPDGSFEFRTILRDSTYTARIVPPVDGAPVSTITVTDKDLSGIIIEVPRQREVVIRTMLEDRGAIPAYMLSLEGASSSMRVAVTPDGGGMFKTSLPEDEREVWLTGLPLGYFVKSLTYGTADLGKTTLRLFGTPVATEVRVTLAADPNVPFADIQGRLSGLAPDATSRKLILRSAAAVGSYESMVAPDGTFSFSKIPQGLYAPALSNEASPVVLAPSLIAVNGSDITGVELTAKPSRTPPLPAETLLGATVTDLGGPPAEGDPAAVAALRTINTALITFLSTSGGRYGNIAEMVAAGLLDMTFAEERNGYRFAVVAVGSDYVAAAIPVSPEMGRYGFYSVADAVVRYSTVDALAPPAQTGAPVR